jgi:OPA family glycerol-3-phosphate transporter-like MFS transporter 3
LKGLFVSGILGDRFDLRLVLTFGMTLSAVNMFIFGVVSEWLQVYNKFWYLAFWILNGFAQSTGWPAVVAVMGNWFSKDGRGLIFGIWAANASVGNILGALMVSAFINYGYHVKSSI